MKTRNKILIGFAYLIILFGGMTIAHLMNGGKIWAEPCHSLLWCN